MQLVYSAAPADWASIVLKTRKMMVVILLIYRTTFKFSTIIIINFGINKVNGDNGRKVWLGCVMASEISWISRSWRIP